MKTIKVTTDSQLFRQEQFRVEMFNGREIPVMKLSKEAWLSESLFYALYSHDLNVLPYDKNNAGKYLCVSERFYIIAELGEKGFETSYHYFSADIAIKGEEMAINIDLLTDTRLTDAILDKYIEDFYTSADSFNQKAATFKSVKQIQLLEDTEFIRLPYNGNQRKIAARINHEDKLAIINNDGYKYLETGEEAYGDIKIGTLLYKRDTAVRDMVEIVALKKYAHDFEGDFWAVVETMYTYPAEAEKIKAEYPDFYAKECMSNAALEKQTLLKDAKELPYISDTYKIGDGIIYIPIETNTKEISMPVGDFHFIMNSMGYFSSKSKGRMHLNTMPEICSLIEVDRRFMLVYYRVTGFVKFKENYYAELKFIRQSKFFDSLDADTFFDYDERGALACASYLMFRGTIKPVVMAKDELGNNLKNAVSSKLPLNEIIQ